MKKLPSFYSDIQQILQNARNRSYSEINRAMVEAYWMVGKRIVEEEQGGKTKAEYGKKLLENLSRNLTHEFGKGFSYANLRNFRQFYLTYPNKDICYTPCSKLSWSHNRLIMRLENAKARIYYLAEAVQQGWSVRQLQRNINTLYYERLLSSQQPDGQTIAPPADTPKSEVAVIYQRPVCTGIPATSRSHGSQRKRPGNRHYQ